MFIGNARQRTVWFVRRDFRGIRRVLKFVPGKIALVLHDQRPPIGDVIQQALIGSRQFRAQLVRANTYDHRVKFCEVSERQRRGVQHVYADTKPFERLRDGFAFGGDVSNV